MLSLEEIKLLDDDRMARVENTEFMNTIFSIAEKYKVFNEKDIELLTTVDKKTFKHTTKSLMIEITGMSEKEINDIAFSHYENGRNVSRYYKNPQYTFCDRIFLASNDMYGKINPKNPPRSDNRTPFLIWFKDKLKERGLLPNSNEKWIPSIEEYKSEFSKEEWLDILRNPKIVNEKDINILNDFYSNGGPGTCSELGKKHGQTADYYRAVAVNLAEKIIKVTGCEKPTVDGNPKFWPILFVGRKAAKDEDGDFVWKLRDELYDALDELILENESEIELSMKDTIEQIKQYIAKKGFSYESGTIENFYLSLKSKPFVILAGTSGTGKTRLVKLFAEAIGATANNGRYKLVAVRPDWSDSSDLFGHVDLNGNFIPGAITEFIEAAEQDKSKPYFLCLDEMNLARVEYYLSDVLSIMETRDYHDGEIVTDEIQLEKHENLRLPENLYIVGTVNMDETTFPFSKKVLDRANTIEFSYVDLIPSFDDITATVDLSGNIDNDFLKTEYLYLVNCTEEEKAKAIEISKELQEINGILKKADAHVGYRVRDEIVFYILNNNKAKLLKEDEAFDNEILQKILPRIQGSSSLIREMICELFVFCLGSSVAFKVEAGEISKEMFEALESKDAKYKKSAEKLAHMMRRYEEDGFTAYWQ